ncbi:uncharacterized protein LOC144237418 isoform X2 [Crocuta crocuta]
MVAVLSGLLVENKSLESRVQNPDSEFTTYQLCDCGQRKRKPQSKWTKEMKKTFYRTSIPDAAVCPSAASPFYFSGPDFFNCQKERVFLVENSALKRSWRLCKSFEKSVSHQIIHSLLQIQKLG